MHISTATFNSIISDAIGTIAIHESQSRSAVFAHEDGPGNYLVEILGKRPSNLTLRLPPKKSIEHADYKSRKEKR